MSAELDATIAAWNRVVTAARRPALASQLGATVAVLPSVLTAAHDTLSVVDAWVTQARDEAIVPGGAGATIGYILDGARDDLARAVGALEQAPTTHDVPTSAGVSVYVGDDAYLVGRLNAAVGDVASRAVYALRLCSSYASSAYHAVLEALEGLGRKVAALVAGFIELAGDAVGLLAWVVAHGPLIAVVVGGVWAFGKVKGR